MLPVTDNIEWGPAGEAVYKRTYSRTKLNGAKETWPETVSRVAKGNLRLVYGDSSNWPDEVMEEYRKLKYYMHNFALIPGGRHLWASGVEGRQYLFNCHVAGWGPVYASDHFKFTFLRLMEGGGVGSNYSSRFTDKYGQPKQKIEVHITSDPIHADYHELSPYLSDIYGYSSTEGYTVGDSREGWAAALTYLIDRFFAPSNGASEDVIFNVSAIRPSGSPLRTFGGTASGPAPFAKMLLDVAAVLNRGFTSISAMEIDHAIAECVVSGGNRRSARMSIMHWQDPYIHEFIRAKSNTGKHWTTNISVEVDVAFFDAYRNGNVHAHNVMRAVTNGMLSNGEPGFWNSSLAQQGETGKVIATNPCGEIALEAWENCNLGHVNLDWFMKDEVLDYDELAEAHRLMTRFLIRATYGDVNDKKQAAMLAKNRRIGVGHLGVQGFWAKRGIPYNEIKDYAPDLLMQLYSEVQDEAQKYTFQLRIPVPVKLTAVAPTGSIAKLPGVSEGAHPIYARWYERRIRFSLRDADQRAQLARYAEEGFKIEKDLYDASGQTDVVVFPTEDILMRDIRLAGLPDSVVQSADQLTIREMLEVQQVYQQYWADNAVSYTVNITDGDIEEDDLAGILAEFLPKLKGTTVMVDSSRPQAPYTRITKHAYDSAHATRQEDSTNIECSNGVCPVR